MRIVVSKHYKIWLAAEEPSKWSRPALRGVLVNPDGWLIAANGFALVGVRCRLEGDWPKKEGNIIIPAETFRWAARMSSPIDVDADSATIQVKGRLAGTLSALLVDGKYPKWRDLIPAVSDTSPSQHTNLDPRLLSQVAEAMGSPKDVQVWHTQTPITAYIVTSQDPDSFGLIMPIYCTDLVGPRLARVLALRPQQEAKPPEKEPDKPTEGGDQCPAGPESR